MVRHDVAEALPLLFELLAENGVLFVCIDDNELYHLRLMLDELSHNEENWVGTIVWKNVTDNNPTRIAVEHEYIMCFAKDKNSVERVWKSRFSDIKDVLVSVGENFVKEFSDDNERQKKYTQWFRAHKTQLWPLDRYKFIDSAVAST